MASIRQHINVAASPRQVWRALTTVEGLTSWWVDEARVDARAGGRVVLTSEGDDGEPVEERGVFMTLRPIRKIEISWDTSSKAPTSGTMVTFQIARDGDDTRVRVVHSGGGVLEDEEAREALNKGWRQALRSLRSLFEDDA